MSPPKDPIKYEVWRAKQSESRKGEKNPNFGKHPSPETIKKFVAKVKGRHLSEEHRKKISAALRIRPPITEETRQKLRIASTGRRHTIETLKKISATSKGRVVSEATRKKISDAFKGEKGNRFGKPVSEETRKKIGDGNRGKIRSKKFRIRQRELHLGDKSPNWKGGISFEPYCPKFTNEFKERVRAFFDHKCVECGTPQNGEKLSIHHVNFNKQSCCDSSIPLFVSLCRPCHNKSQFNRPFWEQHFTEMINEFYEGKCYLTNGEAII